MKSLKLNHDLAELVLSGQKASTWRVNDEKNISVDDEVELIDKVRDDDPKSWRIIGVATVNQVISKRFGELTPDDKQDHEPFASEQEMYQFFSKAYNQLIDAKTPVKIIRFNFKKYDRPKLLSPGDKRRELSSVKLFADGGSRGNPGPSASGFVITDLEGNVVKKDGLYLGLTTNNQAEYQALKLGLEAAKELGAKQIKIFMDSLLVVNQIKGIYKVRNRDLWPIYQEIKVRLGQFSQTEISHVPREMNKEADSMVNYILDQAR